MAFAGLYFKSGSPSQAGQFVILTTAAEAELAKVHHRSPLVLPVSNWQSWLSGAEVEAEACLVPPLARYFNIYPVASAVGDISKITLLLLHHLFIRRHPFRQSCKAIYSRVNFLSVGVPFPTRQLCKCHNSRAAAPR